MASGTPHTRSVTSVPRPVTTWSNVTVSPGAMAGLSTKATGPPPRFDAVMTRHVVWPSASPSLVTVSVTASPAAAGTTPSTVTGNGPIPVTARRATMASRTNATSDAEEDRAVDLGRGRRPAGRADCSARTGPRRSPPGRRSAHSRAWARSDRRRRPWRRHVARCSERLGWPGSRGGWCHERPYRAPRHQRSTASTSASMSSVVRARTIAPSAPAALPARPRLARGREPGRLAERPRAEPVALEPDEDASGPRAASRPRRAPRGSSGRLASKLSSKALQPSPIRPARRAPAGVSPPMTIRGAGSGTGYAAASASG